MLGSKFFKFFISVLKWQVNSSSMFASFLIVMTHNYPVNFMFLHFQLWTKESYQSPIFETWHFMTLKSDAKSKEKLTCTFKYDMRNFMNFHPATRKSENVTSICYFRLKYIRFELMQKQRSYLSWQWKVIQNLNKPWPCGFRAVTNHDTEGWCKIWRKADLSLEKTFKEFG